MTEVNWEGFSHLNPRQKRALEDILVPDYKYKIKSFDIIEESAILLESKFSAELVLNICDPIELDFFLDQFYHLTSTSYNKDKADSRNKAKFLMTGTRKCMHNVRKQASRHHEGLCADKTSQKNTECGAKISFKLRHKPRGS